MQLSDNLASRNFLLMWFGNFISQFGSQIAFITLMFWLKEEIGLASVMGLSAMLFSIFIALFSPLGGVLADIYSRKTIIIFSDLLAGTVSLILPVTFFFFPDQSYLLVILVLLIQLVLGAALGVYDPAYSSLLSNVVSKKQLPLANAIKSATIQGSMLIGQGLGLLLYGQFGIIAILTANSLSFYLSALSESWISLPKKEKKVSGIPRSSSRIKKFILGVKEGLEYISSQPSLKSLLILIGGVYFLSGPFVVLLPFYIEQTLFAPGYWYGYLIAAFGGGGLIGYLSLPFFKSIVHDWSFLGFSSYLIFGFLLVGLGLSKNIYLTLILFSACGYSFGLISVMIETAILTHTPDIKRGRVMSIYRVVTRLTYPLGMLVSGALADLNLISIELIFITCGVLVLVLSLQQFRGEKLKTALAL
ncbi:MFS transporter [Microbulbifer epialgicus]|uniref:MFS transporter n=1 Tax=Microbulbifer epialgicus TaxID=393907 RepID=A0ABV4P3F2_9GAMM